jgi:glycosyltransferase 2 family protein
MVQEGPFVADARDPSAEIASPPVRPVRRVFGFFVRLAIAGVLLAYLAKSGMIDARALSRPFTAWPIALVAVALILVDVSLMALRLSWLFRPIGLRLPWAKSFQVTLVSFFFAQFLPGATGGDLARLFYVAKDYKGRRSEILTVSLFDRAVGMLSLLVMPLLCAPAFAGLIRATPALRALLISAAVLAALLVAGFLACLYFQSHMERLAHAVFGFLPWKDWHGQIIRTIASYRHHVGTVAAALGISIVANSLLVIVMVLAVFVLNPAGLEAKIALIVPLGFIANCLPFTPGGLGIGEEAFNALFTVAGLTGGAEALLCWRVWTSLVRLLGLVFYLRGIERVFGHHTRSNARPAPATRA